MPVIIVEMWKGRTEDQKVRLIRSVTEVIKEIGIEAACIYAKI